jgi:small subunit ribosomal protein S20
LESALSSGDVEAAEGQYRKAARKLDKAAATSTMHKKTAARKKSRLAKQLNSLKAQKG